MIAVNRSLRTNRRPSRRFVLTKVGECLYASGVMMFIDNLIVAVVGEPRCWQFRNLRSELPVSFLWDAPPAVPPCRFCRQHRPDKNRKPSDPRIERLS